MKLIKFKVKDGEEIVECSVSDIQIKCLWKYSNGSILELVSGEKLVLADKSKKNLEDEIEGKI